MINITPLGAAKTVTGSMHLISNGKHKILLDCGLFQGRRQQARERNEALRVDHKEIDAVVLSHAHIDHSGSLPRLYKLGYRGPIFATPATRDLCAVMLEDSAAIQAQDARYINRAIRRGDSQMLPVEPLYDSSDVVGVLEHMVGLPYRRRQSILPGVTLTFYDAGHVLGSATVALDIDDAGLKRRLLFTGDLGRSNMPILRDPDIPDGVNILISEGTYGDREHGPIEEVEEELAEVICDVHTKGGKVVIPTFALERAQEIVFSLKRLFMAGRLPKIPIYVDSPLTVRITEVFRMHPECYDASTRELLHGGQSPFDFPELKYVTSVEESKKIDATDEPCVIISASGMCEFGRVVHHLNAIIGDKRSMIVIVGFQAQHTLGRRFVEGRAKVRILGVMRERIARVKVLNGFSAHADKNDLIRFAEGVRERGPLRHVLLVHGDERPLDSLKDELTQRGFPNVVVPDEGEESVF